MIKVKLLSLKQVMTTGIGIAGLRLIGARVELLAELHDIEAALAERRANRRAGSSPVGCRAA